MRALWREDSRGRLGAVRRLRGRRASARSEGGHIKKEREGARFFYALARDGWDAGAGFRIASAGEGLALFYFSA